MDDKKDTQSWIQDTLEEHSLRDVVEFFRLSPDDYYYVDRHVVDSVDDIPPIFRSNGRVLYGVIFDICEEWAKQAKNYSDLQFSDPIVVVDDDWILCEGNAPPPHIKMTVVKKGVSLEGGWPLEAIAAQCNADEYLQIEARSRNFLSYRVNGDTSSMGAWYFRKSQV